MNWIAYLAHVLQTGVGNLAAYLAAHVLLCLVPAFFIAGAMMALLPKEVVTRYLGRTASKWVSYPAALAGGFLLAVCSCTILPLFASIYKKGAGLGPALTFMFFAPASNILAILFTGVQIGMDIALARIVLCMVFGVAIGLIMSWLFREEEMAREPDAVDPFAQTAVVPATTWVFFGLLVAVLIAGTLQVGLLKNSYFTFTLGGGQVLAAGAENSVSHWTYALQTWLDRVVPPNPALGIEGVSVHGLFLIGLLAVIGVTSWQGLNRVDEGFTSWTYLALGIISLTLIVAAFKVQALPTGLQVGVTGKLIAEVGLLAALWWMAVNKMEREQLQEWLGEVWRFIKQIIPLLLTGVFLAGVGRALVPATWVRAIAGQNTVWANLAVVIFAVFIYFPTLVEVPVAQTFLALGMHRGPLLAYLLSDPELSLQSVLITQSIIGKKKTAVYVGLVALFSTTAGLIFGALAGH